MITRAAMLPHPPCAIPEIGISELKDMKATEEGYQMMADFIAEAKPDTIIISSPHTVMYRDYFNVSSGTHAHGDFSRFNAGRISFDVCYDEELTSALTQYCMKKQFPAGTEYDRDRELDHGTMVPLYFINQKYHDYKLVRIGLSGYSLTMHYQFGIYLNDIIQKMNRKAVYVASGDLAHCQKNDGPYGYRPEGPEYDKRIMETMGTGRFEELLEYDPAFLEQSMECGHRSFCIMAGVLDGYSVTPHVLSHEAPFGVGYGIVAYEVGDKDEERHFLKQYEQKEQHRIEDKAKHKDDYVRLAGMSLSNWIREHKRIAVPKDLPEQFVKQRAGVFVSIHEHGELRGCIGTISPVRKNIAEEIIENAISASVRDPRFDPISEEELPYLELSVDVLGETEPISDRSQLDVKRYGVICSAPDGRKGLLLPNLEGVDTVDQQISIAARKGGIDPEEDDMKLERFEVVRHV